MENIKFNYQGSSGDTKYICESFVIEDSDPFYAQITNIDFEELIKNPKLKELVIADYYKFHSVDDSSEIIITFSARYDNSSIEVIWENWEEEPVSVSFNWHTPTINETEIDVIQSDVLPDLVNKLLSLV